MALVLVHVTKWNMFHCQITMKNLLTIVNALRGCMQNAEVPKKETERRNTKMPNDETEQISRVAQKKQHEEP